MCFATSSHKSFKSGRTGFLVVLGKLDAVLVFDFEYDCVAIAGKSYDYMQKMLEA